MTFLWITVYLYGDKNNLPRNPRNLQSTYIGSPLPRHLTCTISFSVSVPLN